MPKGKMGLGIHKRYSHNVVLCYWDRAITSDNPNGCWSWRGTTALRGYARVYTRLADNKRVYVLAHHVSYMLHVGNIPLGLQINHHCDNPICTNPSHLYAGTQYENVQDRVRRGRSKGGGWDKTHCVKGHEYTPENTMLDKRGYRKCRECDKAHSSKTYYAKRQRLADAQEIL